MKRVTFALLLTLSPVWAARADVIDYIDVGATPFVTINGSRVTGNGGLVSNYTMSGEAISFDLTILVAVVTASAFTNLIDSGSTTVSDRVVISLTNGSTMAFVQFGSDPNLPTIPTGATDLTTIPAQGLPQDPYFENGTLQLVGSLINQSTNAIIDQFYIQSAVPEPATLSIIGTGLGALGLFGWRRKRKARAGVA